MPRPPLVKNLASAGRRTSQPVPQPFQPQATPSAPSGVDIGESGPGGVLECEVCEGIEGVPQKPPMKDLSPSYARRRLELERQRRQELCQAARIPPLYSSLAKRDSSRPQCTQPPIPQRVQLQSTDEPRDLTKSVRPDVVLVHVYDIAEFQYVNVLTAFGRSPVGGAFHAGVEVYGREWSYSGSGIWAEKPLSQDRYVYRQTIQMSRTSCSSDRVCMLIDGLQDLWPASEYHWLHRNCLAFANEFCERLGVGRIPVWVDRFARGASVVEPALEAMTVKFRTMSEPVHEAATWAGFSAAGCVEELHAYSGRAWNDLWRFSPSLIKPVASGDDQLSEQSSEWTGSPTSAVSLTLSSASQAISRAGGVSSLVVGGSTSKKMERCPCCTGDVALLSASNDSFAHNSASVDDVGRSVKVQVFETASSSSSRGTASIAKVATATISLGLQRLPRHLMVCSGYILHPIYGARMACNGIALISPQHSNAQIELLTPVDARTDFSIPSSSPPTPPPASPNPSKLFSLASCPESCLGEDLDWNVACEKTKLWAALLPIPRTAKPHAALGRGSRHELRNEAWPAHDQYVRSLSL